MSFDFFDIKDEEKPEAKPKKEPEKVECPYCGKIFAKSVITRHKNNCLENPDNIEKTKPKPKVTISRDEQDIIKELRAEFLKTLTKEQKETIAMDPEEMKKIEDVVKFLGGTEGYQFIYKSITGDKIRGTMPHIIDECIKWLNKHKLYLLWNK